MEDVVCEGAVGGEGLPEADEEEILDRLVERVKIKGGLNVDQLRRDGTIFEIDEEAVAATNEEFKEEFAQAQKTSYGQAIGGNGSSFLRDLEYDGLGGYGLGLRDDDNDSDPDGQEPFETLATKMENLTEDGGVKKRMKKPGGGEAVMDGALVHIHYNGYLEHHDEPFDSTRLRNKKTVVQLDKGHLIPGLEIGIKSMKMNEVSCFLITHPYAFGDMGCPPRVPPQSMVFFEVELIHFHDEAKIAEFDNLPPEEMKKYHYVYPAAEERWKEGKAQYAAGRLRAALKTFTLAYADLEACHMETEEEQKNQQTLVFTLLKNIGVVAMKLKLYHKAFKGKPNDKQIQEELDELDQDIERYKVEEKMMAQRMIVPKEEQQPLPDPESRPWERETHTFKMYLKQLESYFEDETNAIFKVPKDRINSNKDILMWEEAVRRLGLIVIEKPSDKHRRMLIKRS